MGTLWKPGEDVDFLARLTRLENFVSKYMTSQQFKHIDKSPYTIDELEDENRELRMRVDDLEEMIIQLSQEFSELEERKISSN